MTIKEITEFSEDERFYDKWNKKIQIQLTLEELQVIISGLHFLKEKYQKDLEDSKNLEGKEISDLVEDIKFTESLYSDLVDTLYYQTDK